MRKLHIISAALFCTAMLASCHNDEVVSDRDIALKISPTLEQNTTGTRAEADGFSPKKQWAEGDEMGLFMYHHSGFGEPYLHFVSQNMRSVYQGGKEWLLDSPIYLNSEEAVVWAYYPYYSEVYDGTIIPVPIRTGNPIDYMWGKSINRVSAFDTDAKIPMNHALSQFVLRLKVTPEYQKEGKLSSVRLLASAPKFSQRGTMDLSQDGKISFEPTLTELAWVPATHEKGDLDYAALVYPMQLEQDEVALEVVLDGETWTFPLPKAEWRAGKRHIYTLQAKYNDLVLGDKDGNAVTVKPWDDTNIDIELEGQ